MGGRPGQQLAAKATSDQLLPKMIPRNCFLSDLRGTSRTGMLKLLTRISVSLLLCFSEMVRARSWTAGSRNARRCRTRRWRRGFRVSEHELPGEMDIELDMDILGLASL